MSVVTFCLMVEVFGVLSWRVGDLDPASVETPETAGCPGVAGLRLPRPRRESFCHSMHRRAPVSLPSVVSVIFVVLLWLCILLILVPLSPSPPLSLSLSVCQ